MVRLSGAAVLLLLVVPLCMYTCALLVGIQLGRALERSPDSANIISIRGIVHYFAKELWDVEGRGRDFAGHVEVLQLAEPVPASPRIRTPIQPKQRVYSQPKIDLAETSATPKSRSHYNRNNHTWPRGVIIVGPWGGSGGQPFYMGGPSARHLRSITVYHSSVIHSLACVYTFDRFVYEGGPWGLPNPFGSRAVHAKINLSAGEHVTAVEGTYGHFRGGSVPDVVITSLTFRTSNGTTYGPYGGGQKDEGEGTTTRFSIPAVNGCIVGFWGRSGWLLDAIGVYIKPCP